MTDTNSSGKIWEEVYTDALLKILEKLNFFELATVSRVCRSWRLACSDPFICNTLDLGLLKSNFIRAGISIWVDERSYQELTKILRISMPLTRGNVTSMVFHINLYMRDDHLNYIAERSPHLRRLVLPAWDCIGKVCMRQALRQWPELESLTMANIIRPSYVLEEISRSCKNFSQLKVMGCFDVLFASALAAYIPKLKVLSLRCSIIEIEALVTLLNCMNNLEVLNISHCIFVEIIPTFDFAIPVQLENSILQRALRIQECFYCQSRLCTVCRRMLADRGQMRWLRYEDWFWRQDEASSLNLGENGKMFDRQFIENLIAM